MRLGCNFGNVNGTIIDDFEMTERAVKVIDGQRSAGYGKVFFHFSFFFVVKLRVAALSPQKPLLERSLRSVLLPAQSGLRNQERQTLCENIFVGEHLRLSRAFLFEEPRVKH